LKLKCDGTLSNFAFKFNLHHYSAVSTLGGNAFGAKEYATLGHVLQAGPHLSAF
jgi:hypothetical protein